MVFDNASGGKLCILVCGGSITAIGAWLYYCGKRKCG